MALNAAKTGKKIADIITDSRATDEMKASIKELWTEIMTAIYSDISADSEITATSTGTATIS
jgi:nitrogenase subunit NifH